MYWWYVEGNAGHMGAGHHREVGVYIYGDNVCEVIARYRGVPGVKYGKHSPMPNITQLNDDRAKKVEEEIEAEGEHRGIDLEEAKGTFYYPKKFYVKNIKNAKIKMQNGI